MPKAIIVNKVPACTATNEDCFTKYFDCSEDPGCWLLGFGISDPDSEILWSKVGPLAVFSVTKGLSLRSMLQILKAPVK